MNFKLTFTEKDTEYYDKWLSFYPKWDKQTPFRVELEEWGYFDPRPQLNFNITSVLGLFLPFFSLYFLPVTIMFLFIGWGKVYLRLPFDTGMNDECENPSYGVNTYTNGKFINEVWFYWGKKRKHIDLPWTLQWYRTSILLKDGTWEHELKGDRKEFYNEEWKKKQWSEDYIYTYTLKSVEVQKVNTTIYVEEREWRPRWFKWTNLFSRVNKTIDVDFSQEVGEGKGSWKGGTVGCGYTINKNETPLQCLKRMESERRFDR